MINELIDNKFDYLEDVMETRFQSLHIDLDILKENFFQEIDILEQKLILNNRFMRGTFEICKIKDDISYHAIHNLRYVNRYTSCSQVADTLET